MCILCFPKRCTCLRGSYLGWRADFLSHASDRRRHQAITKSTGWGPGGIEEKWSHIVMEIRLHGANFRPTCRTFTTIRFTTVSMWGESTWICGAIGGWAIAIFLTFSSWSRLLSPDLCVWLCVCVCVFLKKIEVAAWKNILFHKEHTVLCRKNMLRFFFSGKF